MRVAALLLVGFGMSLLSRDAAAALDHPYDAPPAWALETTNRAVVSQMTPTKDQNGSNLCYGFAATTLLENYLCKARQVSDCTSLRLSPIHVSSFRDEGMILQDRGVAEYVLRNIKKYPRVVREDCAPFPRYKNFLENLESIGYKNADAYEVQYSRLKANPNCASCWNELQLAFPHLELAVIKDLVSKFQYKEFLIRAVIPQECLRTQAETIPAFEIKTARPAYFENNNQVFHLLEKLIMNQIPVHLSIQTNTKNPPDVHAITIEGVALACNEQQNSCVRMLKIKNSYGKNWQETHDDGWVDADNLIEHFRGYPKLSMDWIEKPGQVVRDVSLRKQAAPNKVAPTIEIPKTGVPGRPLRYTPTPAELRKTKLWKCDDGVKLLYTNQYLGSHCKPIGK